MTSHYLARIALHNPAVRRCYCSEKEFIGFTLRNFTFGEDFLRNNISNSLSGYTEKRNN